MNMDMNDAPEKDGSPVTPENPRVVIACRVMETELDTLLPPDNETVVVRYLDQNLHRTPEKMPGKIQAEIERVADFAGQIVLGYGLCSNGIVGVKALRQDVYIPRVHDCISLLMGSRTRYARAFRERPGAYYLTPGWVVREKDPIGMMEKEYAPKMGRETAEWGIREELKHYTHIVLINTGIGDIPRLRERAKKNAHFLNKEYDEVIGSTAFFQKILFGPYDETEFIRLRPGESARQKPFL